MAIPVLADTHGGNCKGWLWIYLNRLSEGASVARSGAVAFMKPHNHLPCIIWEDVRQTVVAAQLEVFLRPAWLAVALRVPSCLEHPGGTSRSIACLDFEDCVSA